MPDGRAAVRLDPANARLWQGGKAVRLTPKAWAVLALLVDRAGQLVTKKTLFETVWPETVVSEAALVVCIREIRRALGDAARTPQYLETVHRRGYRFIGALEGQGAGPPPPVGLLGAPGAALGREVELRQLHAWLAQAQRGERCVGFVTGEAGIGKTTLVDIFLAQAAAGPLWLARGQCVEPYWAGEAYLPVLEALGQLCRGPEAGQLLALLEQQAPLWLLQLPTVLHDPAREALQRRVQGATPARLLQEFAEVVEALTAVRPLVLVFEDLHWSDQATLALVAYLAQRRVPARLLLLGTYRPVEVIVHGHPLKAVKTALSLRGQCVDLALEALPAATVAAVVAARLPGQAPPPAVVEALYRRTDGHPLFLVQLLEALLRQGALVAVGGRWALPAGLGAIEATVPESVRQLIEQQFDGLSAEQQRILEAASVAGLTWAVAVVAAGVAADAERVEEWCASLARQGQFVQEGELVEWPDGTVGGSYQFRHALYQQVIYDRIAAGRRVRLHQRIGLRLEAGYGARASEHAAELGGHFEQGHDPGRAVRYQQQAAAQAMGRYAYSEAIAHLTRGLALLQRLPETLARAQQELGLQLALAPAYSATAGWGAPETVQAYTRADELCRHVQDPTQGLRVLRGLGGVHMIRGELRQAREVSEAYLRRTKACQEPELLLDGHQHLGQILYWFGDFSDAWVHLEQAIALSALPRPQAMPLVSPYDPRVGGHSYAALVLWVLGYPEQALQQSRTAFTLAQELSHPFSLAWALHCTAVLHCHRRDAHAVEAWSAQVLALAREQGFAQRIATCTLLQGWALAAQGQHGEGLARLRQGLAAYRATGAEVGLTYFLALLVDACGTAGHIEEGLMVLAEALGLVGRHGEHFHEAELYRLKGELLLTHNPADPGAADTCFQQALGIARRQQAKSLELRATLSLARLWQQRGQRTKARELLAPIYSWFTEGFDSADLEEAKNLLAQLNRASRRQPPQIDPSRRGDRPAGRGGA